MPYTDIVSQRSRYWRLTPAARSGLVAYCKRLEDANLPVILSLGHIGFLTGLPAAFIGGVVDRPQRYYREFKIPKRSGGMRMLSAPRPFLAHVQRWILDNIIDHLPVHHSASGFRRNMSIVANARAHVGAGDILKMDVADFFGSITRADVEKIFIGAGYSPKVSYYLSRILTLYGRLPQGAPSSPGITNIVMREFDEAVSTYCYERSLYYTRYADDITVSGSYIGSAEVNRITFELKQRGLEVADKKTRIARAGQKQIVTGISISSGVIRLPRERRRRLRQIVYDIAKYGLDFHRKRNSVSDPLYHFRIAGELNYWLQIEPDNAIPIEGLRVLRPHLRRVL